MLSSDSSPLKEKSETPREAGQENHGHNQQLNKIGRVSNKFDEEIGAENEDRRYRTELESLNSSHDGVNYRYGTTLAQIDQSHRSHPFMNIGHHQSNFYLHRFAFEQAFQKKIPQFTLWDENEDAKRPRLEVNLMSLDQQIKLKRYPRFIDLNHLLHNTQFNKIRVVRRIDGLGHLRYQRP